VHAFTVNIDILTTTLINKKLYVDCKIFMTILCLEINSMTNKCDLTMVT
jgi:hypothetical protein